MNFTRISTKDGSEYICNSNLSKVASGALEGVKLYSENGPLVWKQIGDDYSGPSIINNTSLANMGKGYVDILPKERLIFGKADNARAYDPFLDLSVASADEHGGFKVFMGNLKDGDILLTFWEDGKTILPAKVNISSSRFDAELVESYKRDQRCFILDEKGETLVSIGKSEGDTVSLLKPISFTSWLWAHDTNFKKAVSERYAVLDEDGTFLIKDSKTGKTFRGSYKSSGYGETRSVELMEIEWLIASKGLGAIIPLYDLVKA